MTRSLKVEPSTPSPTDRRAEFLSFYDASYSTIVAELLALTGGLDTARAVGAASFSRAWQAWPAIRSLEEPRMWVRADAMTRAYAPSRGMRLLQHGLPAVDPVNLDPEDAVVVSALQRLPMAQRLPLVLHYMAQVPVEVIAEWAKCSLDQVEMLLDDGFDRLVELLDWPAVTPELRDPDDEDATDQEFEWTAEALQDTAQRLPKHITTSPPAVVFRRAAVSTWTRRGAPISAAAAACIGIVVGLTLPSDPATQAAVFKADPGTDVYDPNGLQLPGAQPAALPTDPSAPIRGVTVAQVRQGPALAQGPATGLPGLVTGVLAPGAPAPAAPAAAAPVAGALAAGAPAAAAAAAPTSTSPAAGVLSSTPTTTTTTPPRTTTTVPPPTTTTTTTTPPPPPPTSTTTTPPTSSTTTPPPTSTTTTDAETTTTIPTVTSTSEEETTTSSSSSTSSSDETTTEEEQD